MSYFVLQYWQVNSRSNDTVVKYDITKGLTDLCNILGLEQRGYYKYLQRKNIVADKCVSTTDT